MNSQEPKAADRWVGFRPEIRVLDCTIRDGGLVNDHQFDLPTVRKVYDAVADAGVDYVELGYKASHDIFSVDQYGPWKFCTEDDLKRVVGDAPRDVKISIMADVGRTNPDTDIVPASESAVDLVRVACYIHQIPAAVDMIKDAHDKGYETTLQLMAISAVSGSEIPAALELVAASPVDTVYIVDSFGSMYSEQVRELVALYSSITAAEGRTVGFHGHNNMQLAFANTIEAIVAGANMLDATMNGIGRGAGNCPLELLLGFLHNPKFAIRPVLECCRDVFVPLRERMEWGYSIPYALTGQLNQHPRAAIEWRASDERDDYTAFHDQLTND